jgi:hypothetical protein
MPSLLKSTVVGFGLLAGVAATAHAQSVSTLPPTTPTAVAPPYSSTKIVPNPGNSTVWQQAPNQATAAGKMYPDPGGSTSWQGEHYQPAPGYESNVSQHPYSSIGPKPN